MIKRRMDGLILLLFGAVAFLAIGIAWRRSAAIEMGDFKVVYYSARCLLAHGDPYSKSDVLRVYRTEDRESPTEPALDREVKTRFFYPPTAFVVTLPFALMGFTAGKIAWSILLSTSFILAAIAAWDIGADYAPVLSGCLAALLLMNSFWLFMIGNAAGIAVSLCVLAVWCFYRERLAGIGLFCLALSLALKPNDSGLVWLLLLLVGNPMRKRALQTLGVLAVISVPIVLWVSSASPHWPAELGANMSSFFGVGGIVDPAATGMAGRNMDSLVQLQSAVSILFSVPTAYNLITYAICAPLLVIWVWVSLRRRPVKSDIWIALAVAAPLSMLPTYHLQHDAKILLLAIPGCALLWNRGGKLKWLALLATGAGILLNGDIFSGLRIILTRGILVPQPGFASRLTTALLTRPGPIALLLMAAFYLWVHVRTPFGKAARAGERDVNQADECEGNRMIEEDSQNKMHVSRSESANESSLGISGNMRRRGLAS